MQLLRDPELPDDQLVNFQSSNSSAANHQLADGKCTDSQCTDGHCTDGHCAKRSGCNAPYPIFAGAQELGFVSHMADELSGHSIAGACCHAMVLAMRFSSGQRDRTVPITGAPKARPDRQTGQEPLAA